MKRLILLLAIFITTIAFTYGQAETDSIVAKKVFGGYQFYQGNRVLNMKNLLKAVEANESVHQQIKETRSAAAIVTVFSSVGGFMIGWQLGAALGGGEPNWALAGIGAGIVVVAIPISVNVDKKVKQAVDTFNKELPSGDFGMKKEVSLSMTSNGVGLIFTF